MDKWSSYFMDIAKRTAELSKDPNTKVGAVLVKDKRILSVGYNGAPKSFDDSKVPTGDRRSAPINQKNSYMVHAELNTVLNYVGELSDLAGATLYVTTSPCYECAKLIAQLGIRKVVYLDKYHRTDVTVVSDYILEECGVELISYKEDIENVFELSTKD